MDFQQIRKYVKGVLTNSFLNKTTLDKLSTSNEGNLLFDGKEISGGLHKYSTEEQIVGKWIDGKPIYEKTYILNNTTLSTGNNIFDTIENVKIINSNGRINNYSIPYADGGEYIMCIQSNNEIGLWSNKGFYNQSTNIILTIQYTKTTG